MQAKKETAPIEKTLAWGLKKFGLWFKLYRESVMSGEHKRIREALALDREDGVSNES